MNKQDNEPQKAMADEMGNRISGSDLGASSAIGRRLKAYYDDVAAEPVPDKFLSLLDALDAAAASGSQGRGAK